MCSRFLLFLTLLPCFGRILHANNQIWLTDQQDFQPKLTYPIAYTTAWATSGLLLINQLDQESTGFEDPAISHFYDGFRKGPRFDDNESKWNYIAHPLWGSETYLRARAQGFSSGKSFAFSVAASAFWEFGMESFYQRPSSQDLFITPVTGSVIGELRFRAKRSLCLKPNWKNKCIVFALDPLQTICEWMGQQLGQNWVEPAFQLAEKESSSVKKENSINVSYHPYHPKASVQIVYKQTF